MLDWIRKKDPAADAEERAEAAPTPAGTAGAADARVAWPQALQAAVGDDDALLALLRRAAPLALRLEAVEALGTEAGLRAAERELRNHDRRLHRVAKQRYQRVVATRLAASEARRLIGLAQALAGEPLLAANRIVELDRAWQTLDTALLDASPRDEFAALMAALTERMRDHAERERASQRRGAELRQRLDALCEATRAASSGALERAELAALAAAVQQLRDAAGDESAGTALLASLDTALLHARQLDEGLSMLHELEALPAQAGQAAMEAAEQRWLQAPPPDDGALARALNGRFEQWRQARHDERQARQAQRREADRERARGDRAARAAEVAALLDTAEAALAAGHVAEVHRVLLEIDERQHGGGVPDALRARVDALQGGYARLKGWQHWAGGRARDELVQQAEALAAATAAGAGATVARLSVKQQAEVIGDMRTRWKELDRLGGATSKALWQRFDSALKAAYAPVAASVATQRAAREQNLAARQALLDALESVALPASVDDPDAPGWRPLASAVAHFQTEWRRLGPPEHTVPHAARPALEQRMQAALERAEAPLRGARQAARDQRQRLVDRARELAAAAQGGAWGRELVDAVRELQSAWQQQARALPLPRAIEGALWAEFKAATDAMFAARDAVEQQRDAQRRENAALRGGLIARLQALGEDAPVAELRRTLADAEAQWRQAGPVARHEAASFDAGFAAARDAVRHRIEGSGRRQWLATCDALAAKLALCEGLEGVEGPRPAADETAARWSSLPPLPAPWEDTLQRRAGLRPASGAAAPGGLPATDALLLQLEVAWNVATPAGFENARRDLKLQALKQAMETRQRARPVSPDEGFAALLGRTGLDALQRERLGRLVEALRGRGPSAAH